MDPFTKAVQKARQEGRHGLMTQGRALVPSDIVYSQTRKVDLYPGWLKQNRILTPESQDGASRAYKVLRTQVSQRMRQQGWKTLGVTSPGHREGKTVTSINLSISLALEPNQTVILVDADLAKPSVHTYLGFDAEQGLREHLIDGTPIQQILVHPQIRRLVILPGSHSLSNSSEMLSSPVMLQLVQELKKRYPMRLVIFDLPPVLATDDVLAFAPYIDAVLLVIEEGKTNRDEMARAAELIQASNQNLIGTVLNKSDERSTGYGIY